MMRAVALCRTCKLDCPVKEKNIAVNKDHKCSIPEDRWYATKYGVTQILNKKVIENKFYTVIQEVEKIVEANKKFVVYNDERQAEAFMKQLAFLSKLLIDAKTNFEKPEEIGFDNKDSILTDNKKFLNLVFEVITEELDFNESQKLIAKIHEKTKEVVKSE